MPLSYFFKEVSPDLTVDLALLAVDSIAIMTSNVPLAVMSLGLHALKAAFDQRMRHVEQPELSAEYRLHR